MIILLLFIITIISLFSILIVKEILVILFKVFLGNSNRTITILMTKEISSIVSNINIKILTFTVSVKIWLNF